MTETTDEYLWESEQLVICRDGKVGLYAAIAIDNTARGPGFGGVRLRPYPSARAGIIEAQRLAAAMTLKNAIAGIPYGGAKSVIFANRLGPNRVAIMSRFGEYVAGLNGAYMPGVDMGTSVDDLRHIGAAGAVVACSETDPSPWTAAGVVAAVQGAVEAVDGDASLEGKVILVQGVGHVGEVLALSLHALGARILVSDLDSARAAQVAKKSHGRVVSPDRVVDTECDVFAPCASAGVITAENVHQLSCRIIAGAANDPLSHEHVAELLAQRDVTYVPDFVSSAGGVLQVHADRIGWSRSALRAEIQTIRPRVKSLVAEAGSLGMSTLTVAREMADTSLRST